MINPKGLLVASKMSLNRNAAKAKTFTPCSSWDHLTAMFDGCEMQHLSDAHAYLPGCVESSTIWTKEQHAPRGSPFVCASGGSILNMIIIKHHGVSILTCYGSVNVTVKLDHNNHIILFQSYMLFLVANLLCSVCMFLTFLIKLLFIFHLSLMLCYGSSKCGLLGIFLLQRSCKRLCR